MGSAEIQVMLKIIRANGASTFKNEFANIGEYDTSDMGKIVAEM